MTKKEKEVDVSEEVREVYKVKRISSGFVNSCYDKGHLMNTGCMISKSNVRYMENKKLLTSTSQTRNWFVFKVTAYEFSSCSAFCHMLMSLANIEKGFQARK